jgi:hypothetical protein
MVRLRGIEPLIGTSLTRAAAKACEMQARLGRTALSVHSKVARWDESSMVLVRYFNP